MLIVTIATMQAIVSAIVVRVWRRVVRVIAAKTVNSSEKWRCRVRSPHSRVETKATRVPMDLAIVSVISGINCVVRMTTMKHNRVFLIIFDNIIVEIEIQINYISLYMCVMCEYCLFFLKKSESGCIITVQKHLTFIRKKQFYIETIDANTKTAPHTLARKAPLISGAALEPSVVEPLVEVDSPTGWGDSVAGPLAGVLPLTDDVSSLFDVVFGDVCGTGAGAGVLSWFEKKNIKNFGFFNTEHV